MEGIQRKYSKYTVKSDSTIVFQEKKSKMTFLNPQKLEYEKVHVDGEEITDGLRCDYLLAKYDTSPLGEYYVELKGSDVMHAIRQLNATICKLSVDVSRMNKYAFVVATNVSPKIRTNIQKEKVNFMKDHKAELIIKESGYKYSLNKNTA